MYTACIYKYFQIAAESFPRKQIFSTHSDYRKDRKKKIVKRGTCSSCVHLLNAEETTSRSESNQIKSNPTSLCGCRSLKNSFLFRYHCYRGPLPFPSHPIPPYSGRLDKKHSFLFEYSAQWDKGNRFLLSSWIRNACMF